MKFGARSGFTVLPPGVEVFNGVWAGVMLLRSRNLFIATERFGAGKNKKVWA